MSQEVDHRVVFVALACGHGHCAAIRKTNSLGHGQTFVIASKLANLVT